MKILFAPSETKNSGGDGDFEILNLLFPSLAPYRLSLIDSYMGLIGSGSDDDLRGLFGLKNMVEIERYRADILSNPITKAIQRYDGVAFDYLDYHSLSPNAKDFIDSNLIIFSNLFGPIRASDLIPDYRLKQGVNIGVVKVEKFYHDHSFELLESFLADDDILDLRAGYYEKFYRPTKPYTTLKFIKEGNVVSHWAKAYRGLVARAVAEANIQTMEEFMQLQIKGLNLIEIQTRKNQTQIIYNIAGI